MTLARSIAALSAITLPAIALLTGAPAVAQDHGHGGDLAGVFHVGNEAPYPMVRTATRANRRKARALSRATRRAAARYDTVEEAARRGYVADATLSPLYQPGLQHFRKNGTGFWGRLLDPRAPQGLVFWCPSSGDCRLAALIFRAPGRMMMPPTYGDLLGWHRHRAHGTWMTHVWLTRRANTALAQCAPFDAMHLYNPTLAWEPYVADVPMVDDPCPPRGVPSGHH
jgi:hypothetical protein